MTVRFNFIKVIGAALISLFTFFVNLYLFSSSLFNAVLCVLLGMVSIYLAVLIIDNKPRLIFDNEGVSYRPFPFILSSYVFMEWSSISYFEFQTKDNDGIEYYLVICLKSSNKEKKINIGHLEFTPQLITAAFKEYALANKVNEYKDFACH